MMNSRKSFSESLPQSDQQKIRRIFSLQGNGEIAGMTWIYSCRAFSLEMVPGNPACKTRNRRFVQFCGALLDFSKDKR